ncbi:opsin Rh4-like [Mizuhopecten yessoensis]|uniref:Cholecystokinin receptor type A n=1 Tax=Mizuhopecten yessoensis TaxID=6573 RepID=A0A210QE43_MIZYE|nr:opsin Rh4-like [Mizuhopecten yessoensis]OWF47037.1 Cholecystokinin receptor type A [Mizuhopecten yessoensis]
MYATVYNNTASHELRLANLNSQFALSLIVIDIILGFYFVFGVLGNAIVIYIYSFRLRVKLDDKFFILVLAIMDIIVCVTGPSFCIVRNVFPIYMDMDLICKMSWFFTRNMNGASGLLILVIGLQRFLKVCRPFGRQMTKKYKVMALIGTICVTIVIHTPLFIFYGITEVPFKDKGITGRRCGLIHGQSETLDFYGKFYLYFMFASAVLTMIGICSFYVATGKKIYMHIKRIGEMPATHASFDTNSTHDTGVKSDHEPDLSTRRKSSKNINIRDVNRRRSTSASVRSKKTPFSVHRYSIMFLIISLLCVLTYVPALATNLAVDVDSVEFWTEFSDTERQVYLFVFQMYLLNHVVNPIIYTCFDTKFRHKVKEIFC